MLANVNEAFDELTLAKFDKDMFEKPRCSDS